MGPMKAMLRPRVGRPLSWLPLVLLAACGGGEPSGGGASRSRSEAPATVEELVARERAAAHFSDQAYSKAMEALRPLLEREDVQAQDLLRASNVALAMGEYGKAEEQVRQALALDDSLPGLHWNLYRTAYLDGDFEAAVEHVSRAHALAPDDYPTHLALATALNAAELYEEAEAEFQSLLAIGEEFSGSWYLTTLYQYSTLLNAVGRYEEGAQYRQRFAELQNEGFAVPSTDDLDRGTFGQVQPPAPSGSRLTAPAAPSFVKSKTGLPAGALMVQSQLVVEDPKETRLCLPWSPAPDRAVALEGNSWKLFAQDGRGGWTTGVPLTLGDDPSRVALVDLTNDGRQDLLAVHEGKLQLVVQEEDVWSWQPLASQAFEGRTRGFLAVDYDHEGDLDLVLVGDFGGSHLKLLRNDGVGAEGGDFTDVTEASGLPTHRPFTWILSEDFDTDNDVDLLLGGGEGGVYLASNERGGLFAEAAAPRGLAADPEPRAADFDGDGRPDLVQGGDRLTLYTRSTLGGWAEGQTLETSARTPLVADADLDGSTDLLWPEAAGSVAGILAVGTAQSLAFGGAQGAESLRRAALAAAPITGLWLTDEVASAQNSKNAFGLELRGVKDNRYGVGAIVEVRAGGIYRRIYWRGEPQAIGLGDQTKADVVRITWPNGVVQNLLDLEAGQSYSAEQKEGLVGSCPFLYTWNGTKFEFISDVLGITPLGLPMAPGVIVPPDHDEYVLIRGDQLVPRGDVYALQVTEELREVTYLDRVRLEVIDHPEGTEVQPNERFTFPPFPEHEVHLTRAPLAPLEATDDQGRNWTRALAAVDDDYAAPFEGLGGQFLGLAEPHTLELAFDPEAVRDAKRLRLFLTGWFLWTDASVNVASAGHPTVEFVPPLFQVPDGEGGWRDVGPPVGFPAGKTKTMVIDVGEWLDRENPRLRVFTTLALYWDAIRLAVDAGDEEVRQTSLEPVSALLWERGFSEPQCRFENRSLEWFDWEKTAQEPRWNQHPGFYTRHGEVVPLLGAIDDRFVIMGSGDALELTFDATEAPELPEGWTRDYLLFLDGWAKDRDPNSANALYVEPYPFHGMSTYPYGEDESYPWTEENLRYNAEWNTRPAKTWIEEL